jgi:hypothetical protein
MTAGELELTLWCGGARHRRMPVSAFDLAWSRSSPARDLWFRIYLGRAEPRYLCFQCWAVDDVRCKRATARRKRWQALRSFVLDRDGYQCKIRGPRCRRQATTLDHIWPWSRGGTDDPSNLQAACVPCNSSKGATIPAEMLPIFTIDVLGDRANSLDLRPRASWWSAYEDGASVGASPTLDSPHREPLERDVRAVSELGGRPMEADLEALVAPVTGSVTRRSTARRDRAEGGDRLAQAT